MHSLLLDPTEMAIRVGCSRVACSSWARLITSIVEKLTIVFSSVCFDNKLRQ